MAKIPRGIVITTSQYTKDWLPECLASIMGGKYPILLVSNGGYVPEWGGMNCKLVVNNWNAWEVGGIARGAEVFDEFVHLMDTCVVKDYAMFDIMFDHPGSVHLCPGFFSYLGKYRTNVLGAVGIPQISTKEEAITCEHIWNRQYLDFDPIAMQFEPELPITTDVFVEKHGRTNMVIENPYIIKWKATHR